MSVSRRFSNPLLWKPFDHLVVLDFEWTCCNRRKMEPHAEIIEFPSVLLRLRPGTQGVPASAEVVAEFQTYAVFPNMQYDLLASLYKPAHGLYPYDLNTASSSDLHRACCPFLRPLR